MSNSLVSVPWVNGSLISHIASTNAYSNSVRLIGKVLQDSVGNAIVESTDGRQIKILSKSLYNCQFVCVGGRVLPDGSVEETVFYAVEESFNPNLMNEMIVYSQKFPQLF